MKNDKGRITRGFATREKYVEKYLGQFWRDKNIRVAVWENLPACSCPFVSRRAHPYFVAKGQT